MPIVTLANVEKTFGDRVLFQHLDFGLDRGERVGLIGANGAGKSSLFKLLMGQLTADDGVVAVSKGVKLGMLEQDPTFDADNDVMDEAELAFAELHRLHHELRHLEHLMGEQAGDALEKTLEKYQDVQHAFDLAGGYAFQHKLEATLLGVGLARETWEQRVATLSGGQRSRLALAKLLISEPDVLLLDEPTNHLDLAAIEWLETYLADFGGAVVIISHDRYLLDRLATRIAWLNRAKIDSYPGNYTAFTAQKELHDLTQARQHERQQADIEKQKEFVRRFGAGQRAKEAKGREKRLNRLLASDQMIDAVQQQRHVNLSISTDQRAGDKVLSVRELSKGFDNKPLWDGLKFEVKRGERVGIIGPNGSGKTTLLRVLLGEADADAGDVRWGANLNIGYYDQRLDQFDPDATIVEEIIDACPHVKEPEARNALGAMLFSGDDIYKTMNLLSGGERARVRLTQLLLDKPNVLVLDEPTNHLDIASAGALENALRDFPGTLIFVSHDRYFLDRVAKRLFVIEPPNLDDFDGAYSAWAAREKARAAAAAESAKKASGKPAAKQASREQKAAPSANRDNPYARPFGRLSVKELEEQITETEIALAEAQTRLADTKQAARRGQQLQHDCKQLHAKLTSLEAEYFARQN